MRGANRDLGIIRAICNYCEEVIIAHEDFAASKDLFLRSSTYRNAVTMPILQIGELVKHLSEAFLQTNQQIPWQGMRGIRNLFAHQYHAVDFDIVWTTSLVDIPALRSFCEQYLAKSKGTGREMD